MEVNKLINLDPGVWPDPLVQRPDLLIVIEVLEEQGHSVTLVDGCPGLYQVDDGPELTINQLFDLAFRQVLSEVAYGADLKHGFYVF